MAELTDEAKAARAAYMREWRRKNPEKVREYDARRWQNLADREKEGAPCHDAKTSN